MIPVLKMLGKGLLLKTMVLLVFFLWLVKSRKSVNNRIVDHLEKCGLFSDFQYGFRSSGSTADLLTVVSDRIARIELLFVIFLSVLMILLSILSVIRHLICGNNLKWLLNMNLIYETL